MPIIDLTDLLVTVLTLCASYALMLVAPIVKRRLGVDLDELRRLQLAEMMHSGIRLAMDRHGGYSIKTKNKLVHEVAAYLSTAGADTLRDLKGLDPDGKPTAALLSRIESDLVQWGLKERAGQTDV